MLPEQETNVFDGIGIVLYFSWDNFMSQEKLQTKITQNFGVYCTTREDILPRVPQ